MFGRYVKLRHVVFCCCLLALIVTRGSAGSVLRVCSSAEKEHVTSPVYRSWKCPLSCKRCLELTNKSSTYLRAAAARRYDSADGDVVRAARRGLGHAICCWNTMTHVQVSSPPRAAFLTVTPDYVSEASLAGEWELRFYPDGPREEVDALVAGFQESSDGAQCVLSAAFDELYRTPARPSSTLSAVLASLAPPRSCLQLSLQADRLGLPKDTRFPPAVWQLKRRPYSSLHIEIEMAFLPENPQFILIFEAPVLPGKHFPQAVCVQEGTVSFAVAPFLPWQKSRIGKFTMTPKALRTIVDPVLL